MGNRHIETQVRATWRELRLLFSSQLSPPNWVLSENARYWIISGQSGPEFLEVYDILALVLGDSPVDLTRHTYSTDLLQ